MYDIIINNIPSIIIAVTVLVVLGILYKNNKKELVKAIVLSLVVKAEQRLGSGTGELKYATVIETLYDKLPAIVRFLFTKKELDSYIEEGVKVLQKVLTEGNSLSGYDEEKFLELQKDTEQK